MNCSFKIAGGSKCLADVEQKLNEKCTSEWQPKGWEVAIVNPQCSTPNYKSLHQLSFITSHHVKSKN